ncbi:MAG: hypothetical protein QM754_09715 [Tepidisphaeraceae bacterium]
MGPLAREMNGGTMPVEPLPYATPKPKPSKLRFWVIALLVFSPAMLFVWWAAYVILRW